MFSLFKLEGKYLRKLSECTCRWLALFIASALVVVIMCFWGNRLFLTEQVQIQRDGNHELAISVQVAGFDSSLSHGKGNAPLLIEQVKKQEDGSHEHAISLQVANFGSRFSPRKGAVKTQAEGSYEHAADFIQDFKTKKYLVNISLWIPASHMIANCGSSPHYVPYVVCLRHSEWLPIKSRMKKLKQCKWGGGMGAGSSIRVSAIGRRTFLMAGLASTHFYSSCFGIDGEVICECQQGDLEINDVDVHQITATVLQRGCEWETGYNVTWEPASAWTAVVTLTMLSNTSCPIDSYRTPLPMCLGRHAAGLPGRWVAQDAAGTSAWSRSVFDEGRDTINDFIPKVDQCENYSREGFAPFVWMPWGCQMLFYSSSMNPNPTLKNLCDNSSDISCWPTGARLVNCFENYKKNQSVYVIGDSHGRIVWQNWMASVQPNIQLAYFYDYCQERQLSAMLKRRPHAELIIFVIGNWDAAWYNSRERQGRTLGQTLRCIDKMLAFMAKLQLTGTEVRLTTPVSFCCGYRRKHKGWNYVWKVTQLLGQGVRRFARQHGIPLWDVLQITNGMEMNAAQDRCNHYNGQMYNVLVQVLCNSLASDAKK